VDGTVNNNCRLDPKPIRWDYYEVPLRRRIYDVQRAVLQLRMQSAWKEGELSISLANQFEKKLQFRHMDMDIAVVGNFHIGARTISPGFTRTGWWYDYLEGDSLWVSQMDTAFVFNPGEYHIYTTRRIDLGFDITTSVYQGELEILPLTIVPTLHQGQFTIFTPGDFSDAGQLLISDLTGRAVQVHQIRTHEGLEITMENPAPGVYFVQLIVENKRYTGKMIVP
jgi:hypothetical protein